MVACMKIKVWVVTNKGRPVEWGWSGDGDLAVIRGTVSRAQAVKACDDVFASEAMELVLKSATLEIE
jgi:hypothetical protein